ncbi:ferredoxin reductase family protein [Vibrio marisflavi]|uniref:Flavohemoprotein n=1 Tax=Vibrio marisflavi CECT 7928 TaxID=634439 RepID=A0ABM8ZZK3_9VIBR|nr:ferric reductase-like transmembrane domain-containing protein [Vibrio marisflavi]CAH0536509.1 Flavohemoprotein [Vibrio marisflavi CECT 7928]
MTIQLASPSSAAKKQRFLQSPINRMVGYCLILLLPYIATYWVKVDYKGWYVAFVTVVNFLAMAAFLVQFPLASRIKNVSLFSNINWSISQHKTAGKWIGVVFLLHPALILAPKFAMSWQQGVQSTIQTLTSPQMLTGIFAWVLLLAWVLISVYKERLAMRYETWRLTHTVGFVLIAILATLHVTSVGIYAQSQVLFNAFWWGLAAISIGLVGYNYFVKPSKLKSRPFVLNDICKISTSDWLMTLKVPNNCRFNFEAGQFVWLNSDDPAKVVNDHPFSIATIQKDLPYVSFIIRNLGDYTSKLGQLEVGQKVYVDGPYGSLTSQESIDSIGVTLIAGGSGIGPMLSLLREFACTNDPRPIRLIYGNHHYDQFVFQEEIKHLESKLKNFSQLVVCMDGGEGQDIYRGPIDMTCLSKGFVPSLKDNWSFYVCGSKAMVSAVNENLRCMDVSPNQIHFEKLAF